MVHYNTKIGHLSLHQNYKNNLEYSPFHAQGQNHLGYFFFVVEFDPTGFVVKSQPTKRNTNSANV